MYEVGDLVRERKFMESSPVCVIVELYKQVGLMEIRPPFGCTIIINVWDCRLFKKVEK